MNQNKKRLNLIVIVIFQILLLINLTPSSSYLLHQTDLLIEESRIEKENKDKSLIDSGINLLIGFLSIKQIGTVSAAENSWCCPRTKTGAICQNIPAGDSSSCSENPVFSECEKTTKCKTGTCIDEEEGICSVGTGYECESEWDPNSINSIDKCKLGCCMLDEGTRKEYVRQLKCTKEGGIFDSSIPQVECRISNEEMGACILGEMNCKVTTNDDCEINLKGTFYKGSLCSNPNLETKCEKPVTQKETKTTCKDNKVYFLDTCGNAANIYNANKADNPDYWAYIQEPECDVDILSDGSIDENAAKICGNCDSSTSICDSPSSGGAKPDYGDYICKSLNCEKDDIFFSKFGRKPMNGESWCIYESYVGDSKDVVGSEYRVAYCDKGKIKTELCENYRGKVCGEKVITSSEGRELSFARCRFNEGWKCYSVEMEQYTFNDDGWLIDGEETKAENKEKCEEISDCKRQSVDLAFPPGGDSVHIHKFDICAPKYPPGLQFWESSSNAKDLCGIVNSAKCTTRWTKWGTYWCVGNCACLSQDFADQMNDLCISLGDCGGKANVVGVYTKNFKTFNINKDLPKDKKFELQSFIESDPNIDFGSKELGPFGRGNVGKDKKEEYKNYAEDKEIGKGDPPKFFSSTEEGLFGGDPLTNLGFLQEGWEPKKIMAVVTAAVVAGGAVIACIVVVAVLAVGATVPVIGWIVDIIILIVAAIIILIIYLLGGFEDPINVEIEFTCKPWQAPVGGQDCKKCNEDPMRPCTEYKCKSLGAACDIVKNVYESENPICVSMAGDDVNPPIITFGSIKDNYAGEEIDNGVRIRDSEGGCIQEFSPINFTLRTKEDSNNDDYARCVYNWEGGIDPPSVSNEYELEGEDFKEGNFYSATHNFDGRLPLLSNEYVSNVQGEIGQRQGELRMYVRCMDPNGNSNINEYIVDLCIKEGPDETAANIMEYLPKDKSFLAYGKNDSYLRILLNEPANCKWIQDIDKEYDKMNNFSFCELYAGEMKSRFECLTTLTNLTKPENKIYIKCKDQPWISEDTYAGPWTEEDRNVNAQGFPYTLYSTQNQLKIDSISPQGEIVKGEAISETEMKVTTSGGAYNGNAICKYNFIEPNLGQDFFFQTSSTQHKQPFSLMSGIYNILITCEDKAKNKAEGTAIINMIVDSSPPKVIRDYKEGGNLKIITDEKAICYYDTEKCYFNLDDKKDTEYEIDNVFSTEHTVPWKPGVIYYIKCKDIFNNINQNCIQKITPSS